MDRERFQKTVEELLSRGTTKSLIAAQAGVHSSELSTVLNGGRIGPNKEELLEHFVTRFIFALELTQEYWPGLRLDLRNGDFVKRLIEACDQVRRAEMEEKQADTTSSLSELPSPADPFEDLRVALSSSIK